MVDEVTALLAAFPEAEAWTPRSRAGGIHMLGVGTVTTLAGMHLGLPL